MNNVIKQDNKDNVNVNFGTNLKKLTIQFKQSEINFSNLQPTQQFTQPQQAQPWHLNPRKCDTSQQTYNHIQQSTNSDEQRSVQPQPQKLHLNIEKINPVKQTYNPLPPTDNSHQTQPPQLSIQPWQKNPRINNQTHSPLQTTDYGNQTQQWHINPRKEQTYNHSQAYNSSLKIQRKSNQFDNYDDIDNPSDSD